jgi:hypothetical protein
MKITTVGRRQQDEMNARAVKAILKAWKVEYKIRHARDLDPDKDTVTEERRK